MSKRVSNSFCYYGAAAQSKTLSVGHLKQEQKQARREAETTLLPSQLNSVHHGYKAKAFNYSPAPSIRLSHGVKATLHWRATLELSFCHIMSFEMFSEEQQCC